MGIVYAKNCLAALGHSQTYTWKVISYTMLLALESSDVEVADSLSLSRK